jgi:hypothetical protein
MNRPLSGPARRAGLLLLAAAAFGLSSCEGENAFRSLPTELDGRPDNRPPSVSIEHPEADGRVAVGDSVLVRIRVADDQAVRGVELEGFALRGSATLGTQTRVARFQTKSVAFDSTTRAVTDTVLMRYLLATQDTLPEDGVLLVARVRDRGGNMRADTLRLAIGGPRVEIGSPLAGASVRAGADVRVRILAADRSQRIREIRLQASGSHQAELRIPLEPAREAIDTTLTLTLPASAVGEILLRASATGGDNSMASSAPVTLQALAPVRDTQPPVVRFRMAAPARAERGDTVEVTVTATDSTRVAYVGVSLLPEHRLGHQLVALPGATRVALGDSATFRIALAELGVPVATDSFSVRLAVTAFAADTAGNCGAANQVGTPLSIPCVPADGVVGAGRPGARLDLLAVPGTTVRLGSGDRIADLASDGRRLFLSNILRNRLEVLEIGQTAFSGSLDVGARPWGLAFNRDRSRLYVANSGGTNISVVSPTALREVSRIQTPNVKLYNVVFEAKMSAESTYVAGVLRVDSVSRLFPTTVVRYDYSDRPQFIGVTRHENLVFSTRPTGAAPDGTVRFLHMADNRLEIVTDYAEERMAERLLITNADSVFLVPTKPNNLIRVCPRPRSRDRSIDGSLPAICLPPSSIDEVQETLEEMGYDTEFRYNVNIAEVGLSDTTFVAVSGDHSTVAVGEGTRGNGRVMVFMDNGEGAAQAPLFKHGEIRDLVGNAAERLTGLALNSDGSLGIARGSEAFFFSRDLRLQGVVGTGSPGGGVDMHPENPGVRWSFVSGVEASGLAYVDVIDTFHFRRVRRIFLRDPVTGPLRAVPVAGGALKLYAVTARGLVVLDVDDSR